MHAGESLEDRARPERPKTMTTPAAGRQLKAKIKLDPLVSLRQHAKDMGVDDRLVRRMADEISARPLAGVSVPLLAETMRMKHLERCKKLLKDFSSPTKNNTVFL